MTNRKYSVLHNGDRVKKRKSTKKNHYIIEGVGPKKAKDPNKKKFYVPMAFRKFLKDLNVMVQII